ncbi:zinc ribbon domain-containing protein [Pectinatus sottacetonis]|uniref:zinc ribbon domain-containing protein n=1 Tax=Pectinatus sottacetonis TaxID=1002795 RepID=UPI0018C85DE0|nr:zinc ribbon domain-containing protein [Pectinatus sottacetonis]
MICQKCNREIGNNRYCPYCGHDNNISIMSKREKENYTGITIDGADNRIHSGRNRRRGRKTFFSQAWNLSTGNNMLSRIIWGIGIVAIISFIIFVALPFLSIAVLSIIVVWIIFKMLR